MSLESIAVIMAAVLTVVLVGLTMKVRIASAGRGDGPDRSRRPGPLDRARDVVDRSIGMYIARRLTRRPTSEPVDTDTSRVVSPVPLSAHGGGSPRDAAAGTVAGRTYRVAATYYGIDRSDRALAASQVVPRAPRERLVRDTGVALVVLAALGLVVVVWPHGPTGRSAGSNPGVVRASVTPTPSATTTSPAPESTSVASPSGGVAAETDVPVPSPIPSPVVTPAPTQPGVGTSKPTVMPTAKPTVMPTAKPTVMPTVSLAPSPEPTASPTPEPTPSPEPSASPTPAPTQDPSPTPTPEPSLS